MGVPHIRSPSFQGLLCGPLFLETPILGSVRVTVRKYSIVGYLDP